MVTTVKEKTFYVDTLIRHHQQRVRVMPVLEAVSVDSAAGSFESMRTFGSAHRPRVGRLWPATMWGLVGRIGGAPALLAEKTKAPGVARTHRPGDRSDESVADHSRIHRSRNRIRQGDRYEAAYAGTRRSCHPDKLNSLRYGRR